MGKRKDGLRDRDCESVFCHYFLILTSLRDTVRCQSSVIFQPALNGGWVWRCSRDYASEWAAVTDLWEGGTGGMCPAVSGLGVMIPHGPASTPRGHVEGMQAQFGVAQSRSMLCG